MGDKDLIDILLSLEARITQLENHYHTYTKFDGRLGSKVYTKATSKPKVQSSNTKANQDE